MRDEESLLNEMRTLIPLAKINQEWRKEAGTARTNRNYDAIAEHYDKTHKDGRDNSRPIEKRTEE